jgi:hypothetical protein
MTTMMTKFLKWNRRRRFLKAYRILRNEAERHEKQKHEMRFVAINESYFTMVCKNCPNFQP